MSKRKVVSGKNLPSRFPIKTTAIVFILVDRFGIDGVWLGVIITILVVLWIIMIYVVLTQEQVEIFPEENNE